MGRIKIPHVLAVAVSAIYAIAFAVAASRNNTLDVKEVDCGRLVIGTQGSVAVPLAGFGLTRILSIGRSCSCFDVTLDDGSGATGPKSLVKNLGRGIDVTTAAVINLQFEVDKGDGAIALMMAGIGSDGRNVRRRVGVSYHGYEAVQLFVDGKRSNGLLVGGLEPGRAKASNLEIIADDMVDILGIVPAAPCDTWWKATESSSGDAKRRVVQIAVSADREGLLQGTLQMGVRIRVGSANVHDLPIVLPITATVRGRSRIEPPVAILRHSSPNCRLTVSSAQDGENLEILQWRVDTEYGDGGAAPDVTLQSLDQIATVNLSLPSKQRCCAEASLFLRMREVRSGAEWERRVPVRVLND